VIIVRVKRIDGISLENGDREPSRRCTQRSAMMMVDRARRSSKRGRPPDRRREKKRPPFAIIDPNQF
jgi:hypothetical protein